MKSKVTFLLYLLFCLCLATQAVQAKPVTYLWDYEELLALRQQPSSATYRQIVAQADNCLKQGPVAVTQKTKCISGDPHNFESLSIYWWPDPQNPNGPYVCKDGYFNPEYKEYDYERLLTLIKNLTFLGKAFFLTYNEMYFDAFCRQLDVWFIDSATRMNPNFEYGQFIPGRNQNKGNSSGIIDAYNFIDIFEGIRLVESVRGIGRKRMKALRAWFDDFADWMRTSELGQRESQTSNNHSIAYDTTLYAIAQFTRSKGEQKKLVSQFYERRLAKQIDDEGKMKEELKRTKALSYSVYNLTHIIDLMALMKADGRELDIEGLKRIQKSVHFLDNTTLSRSNFPYQEVGNWDSAMKSFNVQKRRLQDFMR